MVPLKDLMQQDAVDEAAEADAENGGGQPDIGTVDRPPVHVDSLSPVAPGCPCPLYRALNVVPTFGQPVAVRVGSAVGGLGSPRWTR
ncbi:hypothetical protein Vwe01_54110 [Micromonospora andamanensis]|nr:hypothetical protein Vwe01_54110 [Micromonospora andamanensis]